MIVNSHLVGQQSYHGERKENKDDVPKALLMKVHNLKRNNPKYSGTDQEVKINIDNLNIKMQPISINELLKFL